MKSAMPAASLLVAVRRGEIIALGRAARRATLDCRRRARLDAAPRIPRSQHPQPAHATPMPIPPINSWPGVRPPACRQVVPVNPAGSVRGPRHVVTSGQTPVLDPSEGTRAARQHRHVDRRRSARSRPDRAHGLFLRPDRRGAPDGDRGRVHTEPSAVGAAAREGRQAARDAVSPQPRGISDRLSRRRRAAERSLGAAVPHDWPRHPQAHAHGASAGERLCDDPPARRSSPSQPSSATTASATGITAYLRNGGTLKKAAAMANHASMRTTQLYDRRRDEVSLDEVERIVI